MCCLNKIERSTILPCASKTRSACFVVPDLPLQAPGGLLHRPLRLTSQAKPEDFREVSEARAILFISILENCHPMLFAAPGLCIAGVRYTLADAVIILICMKPHKETSCSSA